MITAELGDPILARVVRLVGDELIVNAIVSPGAPTMTPK